MIVDLSLWKEKLETKRLSTLDQPLLDSDSQSDSDSSSLNQEETRGKSKNSIGVFQFKRTIP